MKILISAVLMALTFGVQAKPFEVDASVAIIVEDAQGEQLLCMPAFITEENKSYDFPLVCQGFSEKAFRDGATFCVATNPTPTTLPTLDCDIKEAGSPKKREETDA